MSLKVQQLVYASRLDPQLRFLAVTLAFHCHNDDGTGVFAGVALLQREMGLGESLLRARLTKLLGTGVLETDGYKGHTRRYRFNLARLRDYTPAQDARAIRREMTRREMASRAARRQAGQAGGETYDRSSVSNLRSTVAKPTVERCQTYGLPSPNLRSTGPELKEPKEPKEQTAADASGHADDDEERKKNQPPFSVYAAIATSAIACAQQAGDDNEGNVREHFKRLCAEQRFFYDQSLVQRATDAAWTAHHKANLARVRDKLQQQPPWPSRKRSRP